MNFLRDELLAQRRWRFANYLLKTGSEWMLRTFGKTGSNTIFQLSILGLFGWSTAGGIALAAVSHKSNAIVVAFSFAIVLVGLVVLLSSLIMAATAAAEKPEQSKR